MLTIHKNALPNQHKRFSIEVFSSDDFISNTE